MKNYYKIVNKSTGQQWVVSESDAQNIYAALMRKYNITNLGLNSPISIFHFYTGEPSPAFEVLYVRQALQEVLEVIDGAV